MPDMSKLLENWSPSPEQEYLVADAPGDKPMSLALRVTPGPVHPEKQILLMQMVDADRWQKGAPRDWLLWELRISLNGIAVLELDGRGPAKRTVEPLKSRKPWSTRPVLASASAFDVALSYNPLLGGISLVRGDDVLTGQSFLKATGDVKLIVGRPPQYADLASPEGWTFDLSWSVGGSAPTLPPVAPHPPTTPPTFPQPADNVELARIYRARHAIAGSLAEIDQALIRLGVVQ